MSRFGLDHLAWAKTQYTRHLHNLADSAIAPPDLEGLGLPHRVAFSSGPDGSLEALERALSARLGAPGGRVLVTAGGSEAIAACFIGLIALGDEVLVESPGYEPHRAVPRIFGARVRTFERRFPERPGAVAAAVEAALSPATRLVVLADLHNPTSTSLSEADRDGLTALAGRRGFTILVDETFRDAGDGPIGTMAARSSHWVSISTLTKAYGIGNLRIGWIAGDADSLARCAEAHNALSAVPSLPGVKLALDLVPHLDTLRERTHQILRENHARWSEFARRHPTLGANPVPTGTVTWCAIGEGNAGDRFSAFASERFNLAVTPGRFFGDPRGVRIALGGEPDRFAAALEPLGQAVATFDPAATPA